MRRRVVIGRRAVCGGAPGRGQHGGGPVPDDARALAVIRDAEAAAVTVRDDIAGAKVVVAAGGRASLR